MMHDAFLLVHMVEISLIIHTNDLLYLLETFYKNSHINQVMGKIYESRNVKICYNRIPGWAVKLWLQLLWLLVSASPS